MHPRRSIFAFFAALASAHLLAQNVSTNLITGRVTTESGAPVTNLTIAARYDTTRYTAITGANGDYSISVPAGWWYVEVEGASERHFIPQSSFPPIEITNAVTAHNLLVFPAPHTIRVLLLDETGAPLQIPNPLGRYSVTAHSSLLGSQISVSQAIQGDESILRVAQGVWNLNFDLPPEYRRPYKNIQIVDESVEFTVRVQKWATNSVISGTIIDELGQPVTNAAVRLSGRFSEVSERAVNPDGTFLFNLPADNWNLYFKSTTHLFPWVSVDLAPNETVHRRIRAPRITSQIRVSAKFRDDAPLNALHVNASHEAGGFSYSTSASSTNGAALLPAFPGNWKVFALVSSAQSEPSQSIVVTNSTPAAVVFEFTKVTNSPPSSRQISGQVVDAAGLLMLNARVICRSGYLYESLLTGADGEFDFSVPGGLAEIYLHKMGPITVFPTHGVDGAEDVNLGPLILPNFTIKGSFKFLDDDGNVIPAPTDYSLRVTQTAGPLTYDSGSYELNGEMKAYLSAGEWSVVPPFFAKGYAYPRPATFTASANFVQVIPVRKLATTQTAPSLSLISNSIGEPILRAVSDSAAMITIETSSDLQYWQHAETRGLIETYADLKLSDLGLTNNQPLFFRAIARNW